MRNSPREAVRVLRVSTIPSTGLSARLAIPVLKAIEVMSRMAVPVVSEPVPAVVGTETVFSWPALQARNSVMTNLQSMAVASL